MQAFSCASSRMRMLHLFQVPTGTSGRETACLQVVSVHKDGNAQSNASQPLKQHLREALCILCRQRIEEVAAQEVE